MARDFTYIDDIVAGTIAAHDLPSPRSAGERNRIYNLGNHRPEKLLNFIAILERLLGRTAQKELLPLQPGDVPATCADVDDLMRDVGFRPATPIAEGIKRFIAWYRDYCAK
jgi:UDP-glucuronate 4-epimerase